MNALCSELVTLGSEGVRRCPLWAGSPGRRVEQPGGGREAHCACGLCLCCSHLHTRGLGSPRATGSLGTLETERGQRGTKFADGSCLRGEGFSAHLRCAHRPRAGAAQSPRFPGDPPEAKAKRRQMASPGSEMLKQNTVPLVHFSGKSHP